MKKLSLTQGGAFKPVTGVLLVILGICLLLLMTSQHETFTESPAGSHVIHLDAVKFDQTVKDYSACWTERKRRLEQRCLKSGYKGYQAYDGLSESTLRNLTEFVIVDSKHRALLLSVPKSGCSSWKSMMLMSVDGRTLPPQTINNWTFLAQHGLTRLQQAQTGHDIIQNLQEYFFILTVRHPFTRLESAYRSKFLSGNNYFMRVFGRDIIKRYRLNMDKPQSTQPTSAFQIRSTKSTRKRVRKGMEFDYNEEEEESTDKALSAFDLVNKVPKSQEISDTFIDSNSILHHDLTQKHSGYSNQSYSDKMESSKPIESSYKSDQSERLIQESRDILRSLEDGVNEEEIDWPIPTFEEFVRYVINRDQRPMNRHWDTYEEIAHPCAFHFSHIAKTESADLDMEYISSQHLSGRHIVLHKNHHALNSTLRKPLDLPLFEQMSDKRALVEKLYQRYSTDMWLFGYTLNTDRTTGELNVGCDSFGDSDICC